MRAVTKEKHKGLSKNNKETEVAEKKVEADGLTMTRSTFDNREPALHPTINRRRLWRSKLVLRSVESKVELSKRAGIGLMEQSTAASGFEGVFVHLCKRVVVSVGLVPVSQAY